MAYEQPHRPWHKKQQQENGHDDGDQPAQNGDGSVRANLGYFDPLSIPSLPGKKPIDLADAERQFLGAAKGAGLIINRFIGNGKCQRCGTEGKPRDKDGAYCFHADGIPAGWFQNHREGEVESWCYAKESEVSADEWAAHVALMERRQATHEEDRRRERAEAAKKAKVLLDASIEAVSHPYLTAKGVKPHGLTAGRDGKFLIPLRDNGGALASLQMIDARGDKRFMPGGATAGMSHRIGWSGNIQVILIAEGFSTGASLHEAIGLPVAVALDCVNLPKVGAKLRESYPASRLIYCADDDFNTDKNPGLTWAQRAAEETGGEWIKPEFGDGRKDETDFNDLHSAKGIDEVRRQIEAIAGSITPRPRIVNAMNIIDHKTLMAMQFPDARFICSGIVADGCTILAGRPKAGKSWLALDLALAVAEGGLCLDRQCISGSVLYCALEDNFRRLQTRSLRLHNEEGISALEFATSWPQGKAAIPMMRQWMDRVGDPALIIIDTLAKIRAPAKGKEDGYAKDYEAVGMFQSLASETGVAIMIVHHTRKGEAEDPFDTVSGTLGLTGSADSILVMERSRASGIMVLHGRGRDLEGFEHGMQFDKDECRWSIIGDANELILSATRKKILATMRESMDGLSPSEIAAISGLSVAVVKKRLSNLIKDGDVMKIEYGKYIISPKIDVSW